MFTRSEKTSVIKHAMVLVCYLLSVNSDYSQDTAALVPASTEEFILMPIYDKGAEIVLLHVYAWYGMYVCTHSM